MAVYVDTSAGRMGPWEITGTCPSLTALNRIKLDVAPDSLRTSDLARTGSTRAALS